LYGLFFSGGTNKVLKQYKVTGNITVAYILAFGKDHLAVEVEMGI
jgi:hypothetical protein